MRRALAAVICLAVACGSPGPRPSSSGSAALSVDDQLLYLADTDTGMFFVLDRRSHTVSQSFAVGAAPWRIAVASDDTIYVGNRSGREVAVIRRGTWSVEKRIALGAEPLGLEASKDGKTLYAVTSTSPSRADVGTLFAIDTQTLAVKSSVDVGNEPRGLALVGDRAVVTLFKAGEWVEVDTKTMKVEFDGSQSRPLYKALNATALGTSLPTFRVREMGDAALTPDGTRLMLPGVVARETAIKRPEGMGGFLAKQGPCETRAALTAAVFTVEVNSNPKAGESALTPMVDDVTNCTHAPDGNFPRTLLSESSTSTAFNDRAIQGPTVLAVDPRGTWLFAVHRDSASLVVEPADHGDVGDPTFLPTSSVRNLVPLGAGADGLALTADGSTAFVYSQFDHQLDVVTAVSGGPDTALTSTSLQITSDLLDTSVAAGRRLFYLAADTRLSSPLASASCNSCHLEGGDDQLPWGFPAGPRDTPGLAGRSVDLTSPYSWSGQFPAFEDFIGNHIVNQVGGAGLASVAIEQQLLSYAVSLPSPFNAEAALSASEDAAGSAAFAKAGCGACHTGPALTDRLGHDLGSGVIDTPSLLGLARTAPYLHDGSAPTLELMFARLADIHGVTSSLTTDEKAALIRWLRAR